MKLYTPARVEALKIAGNGHVMPKPFPGRYPTHIYLQKINSPYCLGKPWPDIVPIVHTLANLHYSPDGIEKVRFIEFDRAHPVVWWDVKSRTLKTHKRLLNLYHPMVNPQGMTLMSVLLQWFGVPQRTERHGAHTYYVPKSIEKGTFEAGIKQLLASPAEKKKPSSTGYNPFYGIEYK